MNTCRAEAGLVHGLVSGYRDSRCLGWERLDAPHCSFSTHGDRQEVQQVPWFLLDLPWRRGFKRQIIMMTMTMTMMMTMMMTMVMVMVMMMMMTTMTTTTTTMMMTMMTTMAMMTDDGGRQKMLFNKDKITSGCHWFFPNQISSPSILPPYEKHALHAIVACPSTFYYS